jgi:2TM family of unknown function (DUF5676)
MAEAVQTLAGSSHRSSPGMGAARTIPVLTLGLSLSAFFVFSYVVCVLGYLLLPSLPVEHSAVAIFLPGFILLSWRSFLLGLVESFAWGWYIAVVFAPLYNFFVRRLS